MFFTDPDDPRGESRFSDQVASRAQAVRSVPPAARGLAAGPGARAPSAPSLPGMIGGTFSDPPVPQAAPRRISAPSAPRGLPSVVPHTLQSSSLDWQHYFPNTRITNRGVDPYFARSMADLVRGAPPAALAGMDPRSAYRSPATQAILFDRAVKKYGSPAAARKWVAPPGRSQHGKGRAYDIWGNQAAYDYMHEAGPKVDIHFPMSWEPWHAEPFGTRGTVRTNYAEAPVSMAAQMTGPRMSAQDGGVMSSPRPTARPSDLAVAAGDLGAPARSVSRLGMIGGVKPGGAGYWQPLDAGGMAHAANPTYKDYSQLSRIYTTSPEAKAKGWTPVGFRDGKTVYAAPDYEKDEAGNYISASAADIEAMAAKDPNRVVPTRDEVQALYYVAEHIPMPTQAIGETGGAGSSKEYTKALMAGMEGIAPSTPVVHGKEFYAIPGTTTPVVSTQTEPTTPSLAAVMPSRRPEARPAGLLDPYVDQMVEDPTWGLVRGLINKKVDPEHQERAKQDAARLFLETGGDKQATIAGMMGIYPKFEEALTDPLWGGAARTAINAAWPTQRQLARSQAARMAQPSGVTPQRSRGLTPTGPTPPVPVTPLPQMEQVGPTPPAPTTREPFSHVMGPLRAADEALTGWYDQYAPEWMKGGELIRPRTESALEYAKAGTGEGGDYWRNRWMEMFGYGSPLYDLLDDPDMFDESILTQAERDELRKYRGRA